MDPVDEMRRACGYLQQAEYLTGQVYSVAREPKVLLSALGSLYNAVEHALTALAVSHGIHREGFSERLGWLAHSDYASFHPLLEEVYTLMQAHRYSAVEFSRNQRYVMCDDDYRITSLSIDLLSNHVDKSRLFLKKVARCMQNE